MRESQDEELGYQCLVHLCAVCALGIHGRNCVALGGLKESESKTAVVSVYSNESTVQLHA